ncbi:MAG: DUF1003 domain-containing protein [Motilibacteraceae bacterium]
MAREARAVSRLDVPREARRSFAVPRYDPDAFGRFAETFARFMGTARFLVYMTVFVIVWMGWNILAPASLRFDDYPFIFLTLMLSLQASYAAPLILLAQNRQADRDRVTYEQDRARAERTIADTEYITRELASLRISLGDVATRDFLRSELRDLLDELREQLRDEIRKDVRKDMRKTLRGRDDGRGGAAGPVDDVDDED